MESLCDLMNNTQVWDAEENYDLFMDDFHDYEQFILHGVQYLDLQKKIQRAHSYVLFLTFCLLHFLMVLDVFCHVSLIVWLQMHHAPPGQRLNGVEAACEGRAVYVDVRL